MTGYGKAEINLENANFTIEVKSLNSKQMDVTVKMSSLYRDKEIGIRKLLSEKLHRGKIELSIWREKSESSSNYTINTVVLKDYHKQILQLKKELNLKSSIWNTSFYELGLNKSDIIPTLLRMPDALVKGLEEVDENEWDEIQKGIDIAIDNLLDFRLDEGEKLEEAKINAESYIEQSKAILNVKTLKVLFNSTWLNKMNFQDVIEMSSKYTVARMIERDDFTKRFESEIPISMHEFLYPLAQAMDSVEINADVELGGTDQKFNLLVGRDLQREYEQSPQSIITLPLLEGTDGVEKMSKSYDN